MGQALYRRYRSRSLAEIVGQKPIVTALLNSLKSGKISHAYLFTGPRGVGKTSIARILAHEINGLEYASDQLPIDIIEVDAASNRGIDEIRLLRERVHIAPVSSKKKVYIIDEVHMLTSQAFNALLKTLEEPPEHVVFILATTEAHKLPETIISRTQRYSFKLATQAEVVSHLKHIATLENIDIEDSALELVAKHSGGSLRDALSLLDQVRHANDRITKESVQTGLGLPGEERVASVLHTAASGTSAELLAELRAARDDGISASQLAAQCIASLRANLNEQTADMNNYINLMRNLLRVSDSEQPETELELAMLDFQLSRNPASVHSTPAQPPKPDIPATTKRPAKVDTSSAKADPKPATPPKPVKPEAEVISEPKIVQPPQSNQALTPETWSDAMEHLRVTSNTIYGVLRMSEATFEHSPSQRLILKFSFPFHQKRISDAKNKQIVLDALSHVGVIGYEVVCDIAPKKSKKPDILDEPPASVQEPLPPEQDDSLQKIRNVFGGAEVLD